MVSILLFRIQRATLICWKRFAGRGKTIYSRVLRIGISYRSRTGGGGAHTIGNVEARRHGAKEFLVKVKDTVGAANYLKLVDHLKGLHGRVITIPQCREAFQSQLHDHPELMNCFDEFLPKKFGGTGS